MGLTSVQEAITRAGGVVPLVALLGTDSDSVRAASACALAELVRGNPSNQSAASAGITPLVALIQGDSSLEAKEEAARALWSFSALHPSNQTAVAAAGGIAPLVQLLGAGGERAQSEAAGALASLALEHDANRTAISTLLVRLLGYEGSDEETCTKAARAVSRLARAHPANQAAIATVGGIAPLVRMLAVPATAPPSPRQSQPPSLAASRSGSPVGVRGPSVSVAGAAAKLSPLGGLRSGATPPPSRPPSPPAHPPQLAQSLLLRELACALWSMAEANPDNQAVIASEGGVPSLIALLKGRSKRAVHRDAAGVLWSLADSPANQRLIAMQGGIPPLVELLTDGDAGAQHTAAGALHSLAALAENRVAIAEVRGVPALVRLLEVGSPLAKEQAAGALASLVVGNVDNQTSVANALVAKLTESAPSVAAVSGIGIKATTLAPKVPAEAQEHVTRLIHKLSLEAENRGALSKAGAIPQLAAQLRDGTPQAMVAAASALAQLSHKSPQYRVQVTAQLIKLLGSEVEEVRQRAGTALKDMSADKGSDSQMTVAMAGGIERFVALLEDGSLEAKEYALWLLCQSTDHASRVSIARAACARPIIASFRSGKLSPIAEEHAAAVLAGLASAVTGVEDSIRACNHEAILSSSGIEPLVRLLRHGSDGAKRHAANALTQLSCDLAEVLEVGDGEQTSAAAEGEDGATAISARSGGSSGSQRRSTRSKLMQTSMAKAGAITAFVEWLFDPSLGRPELAAQALAHIGLGSPDAQVTIAEEGAIPPLVAMLSLDKSLECQKWAASALAALAEGDAVNQIAIAEEGGVPKLVEIIMRKEKTGPHEAATRALWHLAADCDNQLSIAREGGLPPLVRILSEGSEQAQEWAAAALQALTRECAENQVSLYRVGAVPRLVALLACGIEETAGNAQGGLLNVATPSADNRGAVVRALVQLLEARNAAAQMKAAETLAILASRSAANRSAIAVAGAIPPLVRLLGDGRYPTSSQVHAAAALSDLARSNENKPSIISAGGVPPLVRMLASKEAEAQCFASTALFHLSATASAQTLITEHNGISLMVALLSSERLSTANAAAGALYHLASTASNKGTIVKAGGIARLVTLLELTDMPDARESIAAVLAELARANNEKAIVSCGGVKPLVAVLAGGSETASAQKHAACALWGLTEGTADRYQPAITAAGAVPPLVALVSTSNAEAQGYAAAALCNLARDPNARRAIVASGGLEPLTELSTGAATASTWLRSQASGILELMNDTTNERSSSSSSSSSGYSTSSSSTNRATIASVAAQAMAARKQAGSSTGRIHLALAPGASCGKYSEQPENGSTPPEAPTAQPVECETGGMAEAMTERSAATKGRKLGVKRPPSAPQAKPVDMEAIVAQAAATHAAATTKASSKPSSRASSRSSSPRAGSGEPSAAPSRASSRAPSPRSNSTNASRASSPRATGAASRSSSRAPSPRAGDKTKDGKPASAPLKTMKAVAVAAGAFHKDSAALKSKKSSRSASPQLPQQQATTKRSGSTPRGRA